MYVAMAEKAIQDAVIIIGTLLIHFAPIVALFNFGSTRTFIAKTFVDWIGVYVEDLGYDLVVLTPARAVLTIGVCMRGFIVVIHELNLLTNFTMLQIRKFDAIFVMDRMRQHRALIDY